MKNKLISTAKYAGTSITLGMALVQIIVFAFPQLQPISEPLQAIVTFALNLGLVQSGVISEE